MTGRKYLLLIYQNIQRIHTTQHRQKYWLFANVLWKAVNLKRCTRGQLTLFCLSSVQFSSVQFIRSVMSDSLWPHELQHARPPCPSPNPRVQSNSWTSSRWWHPAISSSVVPFSSCSQSLPSIRVFSNESTLCMRWPKYWSLSFSIIPSKEHPGLISFRIWLSYVFT